MLPVTLLRTILIITFLLGLAAALTGGLTLLRHGRDRSGADTPDGQD